jgi:hypothetical protein
VSRDDLAEKWHGGQPDRDVSAMPRLAQNRDGLDDVGSLPDAFATPG